MSDIIIMEFPCFFNKKQINDINKVKPDILLFNEQFVADLKDFNFPDSILCIDFGKIFNKSLKYIVLPKYLKKLKLSDIYSQSLDCVNLPETIEIINFGLSFNNSIFSVKLPKELKELILNDVFNAALPSVLPKHLEKLILGKDFDFSINNFVIPRQLKYIRISGKLCNKTVFEKLPKTIEYIEFVDCLCFDCHFKFPLLETLIIPLTYKKNTIEKEKCNKLKRIKCSGGDNNSFLLNNLPNSVTHLEITDELKVELINLPENLEELFININSSSKDIFIPIPRPNNQNLFHPVKCVKQTNLPITLKTLKLYDINLLKFFDKIPYNCNIVDLNNKTYNNELL